MWFFEFGQIQLSFKDQDGSGGSNQNDDKYQMIKIICDHIECFIRSCPYQEIINSITEHKNGWLHVGGIKFDCVDVVQSQIVGQIECGVVR